MMRFNPMQVLLLLILVALPGIPAWAQAAPDIELTPEEHAWLAEHPEIVLGTPTDYPPMVIKNADGTHVGFLVDFFGQVNQRLDTRIRLHIEDSWADVQEKAQKREIDGLAFGGRDPSREALYNPTDIVVSTYFSVFARSQHEYQIKSFSDLKGMRIGYKRAARPTRSLLEKLPSAILKPYDDHESMTQALLGREVDVIVAWMSYDHWRKEELQGTIDNIMLIEEYPIEMVTHVRKDWPELIPILNKALAALRQDELPRIINKWFGEWPQESAVIRVALTPEEQGWLDQNHTVRVRVGGHAPPWLMNTPEPMGMAVDYLNIIGKQFGIHFEYISDNEPWIDGFKDIAGEHLRFDLYPTAKRTPERLQHLAMSDPYLHSPWVIFARNDSTDILGIEDLRGKNVAAERGYVMQKLISKTEPGIEQVLVENEREALLAVSTGEADAYVGNLIVTSFLLQQEGITNIKISASTPYGDHSQAMATRKEWAPLILIINKGLASITEEEKLAIRNKYISIRYEHGITDKDVSKWIFIVAGSASVIVLFFLLWNQQLGRKVSERTSQLTESEARFRATFAQAAVGIAHVSMAGKFMRVNRKFCDIVGYSEKEMLELTFQDITHPDDLDTDLEYVRRVLNGERESYSLEKRYFKKDGSVVWINLTVSLLFDKEGDPRYFVSVIRDISERKRAEEALRESEREMSTLREELIHATRRMALGELTTAIAHELNQPLAAIMTNAQAAKRFLKRDTPSLEDVEEILDDIVKDDRRAGDIIGKLRGMLKGQQHDFVEIHVNEMIQEVLALVRGDMLLRKIVVETTLAKDIPPLSGDRTQLQQVFLNLMLNAAESLVAVEKNARRITVAAQDKDNKEVWISIGDTGPGFDDAAKDQLFDPFYTTKDEGMGVGLAISSTIVKLHGGRIQAESSHGGGATFHVVLPCPEEG